MSRLLLWSAQREIAACNMRLLEGWEPIHMTPAELETEGGAAFGSAERWALCGSPKRVIGKLDRIGSWPVFQRLANVFDRSAPSRRTLLRDQLNPA